MTKREHVSADYDKIFSEGGHEGVYALPYRHSCYFPLFRQVLREARRQNSTKILEVGCGAGAFADYVLTESQFQYTGFDFSPTAVRLAEKRTGRTELFAVGDARLEESYRADFDTIVCTEVLEHIVADREVVAKWRADVLCICSVPNFDADNHVRFFRTENEVCARYGDLIRIEKILRVRKPELSNISFRNKLKALRWNRYRPKRLVEILGFSTFDKGGGWFLFVGRRIGLPAN